MARAEAQEMTPMRMLRGDAEVNSLRLRTRAVIEVEEHERFRLSHEALQDTPVLSKEKKL